LDLVLTVTAQVDGLWKSEQNEIDQGLLYGHQLDQRRPSAGA
jgi:hypothetical protein